MSTEVTRNRDLSRYELRVDGEVIGIADYHVFGDTVVMPHTVIQPAMRGQGYGAVLVKGALDDVATEGRKVVPRCWYVAEFIDENPAYRALLAG